MSWNDFLPELAVKHEVLESLYADIGTPDDEKGKECQSLFDKFIAVIDEHISHVEQEKIRLAHECEQMMDDIRRMTALVGQSEEGIDKLVQTLHGMNLWGRHSLLREEYTYIFEHYTQRLEGIRVLHRELTEYAKILGPAYVQSGPYPDEGAAVTFNVVQQFSDNIDACEKEQKRRISVVESTVITVKHLWNELGLTAQDTFEREIINSENDSYPITDEAMRRFEMKQKMLEEERSKRETLVKEYLAEITHLWDKLRVEEEEREEFMMSNVGLTMDVIRAYKTELSRLEELKSEKLQEFIMEERDALYELWDKLYYSLGQRESFTPVFDENFTDENLAIHESEVTRLRQEVEETEHILAAIEQYRRMLDDIRDFEITSMDAQRLFHRDPGRLLREEKFRKRIAREFPKVESALEEALYQWQQIKGRPFLVYGEEYINTMKLHAQQAREGKENEKLWREQRKHLSLQRDLRYGSQNPKKTVPNSPHPRRISPSLIIPGDSSGRKSPPPSGLSSPLPQTPSSKRVGIALTNRPGTPSSQHTRNMPSFMPTTPTRARPQTVLAGSSFGMGHNPLLQSPHGHLPLQSLRQNGLGGKFYSRSESPATIFSLTKPASASSSTNSGTRNSGPAAMLTSGDLSFKRSNSVISISSATTEVAAESSTLTRSSRTNRPIINNLTRHSIQEEEEKLTMTPRRLKRTATDRSSPSHTPPGSPSLYHSHRRRKSRSLSPEAGNFSTKNSQQIDSPFISKAADNVSLTQLATKEAEKGNRFMKRLLESSTEEVHNLDESMDAEEGEDAEDSIIELDRSEAEKFFSTSRKVVEVVELQDGGESEGWETENDDSPRSRRQSRNNNLDASSKPRQRQDVGGKDGWNSDEDVCQIERMPSTSTRPVKQTPAVEDKSIGS
ncbi:microtubule associated protein-domain-containing protein [Dissophora ornata]|nr:microtubule associated protein-domain-containing protein [Dissophora ornata]